MRPIRLLLLLLPLSVAVLQLLGILTIPRHPYAGLSLKGDLAARVVPSGPADMAGVSPGDRIIAIAGKKQPRFGNWQQVVNRSRPGEILKITLASREGEREVSLRLIATPPEEATWRIALSLAALLFVGFGVFVFVRAPSGTTLLFLLICTVFGFFLKEPLNFPADWMFLAHEAAYAAFLSALPAIFLHFFLIFPEKKQFLARHRSSIFLLYAPAAGFLVWTQALLFINPGEHPNAPAQMALSQNLLAVYLLASFLLAAVAFAHSYIRARSALVKRKLRVALWGTILGVLPVSFVTLAANLFPAARIPGERYAFLPLLLIPGSFGYAIVRYHIFNIDVAVRKSVIYSLLTAFLVAVYLALVQGLGGLVHSHFGYGSVSMSIVSMFVIAAIFNPARDRIQKIVDTLFHRRRYDFQSVLKRIARKLTESVDPAQLGSTLAQELTQTLKAAFVAVLIYEEEDLTALARAESDGESGAGREIHPSNRASRFLKKLRRPVAVLGEVRDEFDPPLPPPVHDELADWGARLIVPLLREADSMGVIAVGEPLSGEWFSSQDLALLETVSRQAAALLENARLHLESIEKERLQQEMDLARGIQEALLPPEDPLVPSLDVSGVTVPSFEVGGDYFGYVTTDERSFGVALGDVSGKGVAAALVMAAAQGAFRAEVDKERSPGQIITRVNQRICELNRPEKFLCFFYGLIDLAGLTIAYCNAGLTPPLVLRRNGEVERLDRGGLLIGVKRDATYETATVELGRGDILLLFSDGVTESSNGKAFFGDGRLLSLAYEHRRLRARLIKERILRAVREYSREPLQDDLTLVVLKIL